jgi:hypothetical protein
VSANVKRGNHLFFDYSVYDPLLAPKLVNPAVQGSFGVPGTDPTFDVSSALHSATLPGLFPQPYRGWAFAGNNGNRESSERGDRRE